MHHPLTCFFAALTSSRPTTTLMVLPGAHTTTVFVRLLLQNVLLNAAASAIKSGMTFVATQLELCCRSRLYKELEKRYFKGESVGSGSGVVGK
jgi:hypothetical protein